MFGGKLAPAFLLLLIPFDLPAQVTTISNPANPPSVETWELQEVWRLDNDSDEDLPLMGIINQAVVGPDGHVFLLDAQMAHILEISPEGDFVRTLGRKGQGPGELERPNTIMVAESGELGMVQVFPGKLVLLHRDGTPSDSIHAETNFTFFWVREAAGNLVVGGKTMGEFGEGGNSTSRNLLRRYSRDGEAGHIYLESTETSQHNPPVMNEKGTWFPHRSWAMAPDGSVLINPYRDDYRIEWLEPDGKLRRVINRDFEPYVRNEDDREEVLGRMRMWAQGGELQPKKTILDTEPAIERIRVLEDGRIWVSSCYAERHLPEGIHRRYDVYNEQGRLQTEVQIAYPVNRDLDYFALLNDGRFLLYLNGASVLDSFFASVEGGAEEEVERDDGESDAFQVILLERVP